MTVRLLVLALAVIMTGCYGQAESTMQTGNSEFEVEKLFTYEHCTVFRFFDNGRSHYYVVCDAHKQVKTINDWMRSCGKGCTKYETEEIETKMEWFQ